MSQLKVTDYPRTTGIDEEHVRALAGVNERLPPIIVHYDTMCLVDGMHRLSAARLNGADHVEVQFFHGSATDAFLHSVRSNVTHGLPLTLADRKAAATRIVAARAHLSDRAIAHITGLSAGTVATIRRASNVVSDRRIGRDGRVRPVSAAEGRRVATQVLTERPDSSLREVARIAGISVGTARDVRVRLQSNPGRAVPANPPTALYPRRTAGHRPCDSRIDGAILIEGLRRDPSIRYTEQGREMLRWLSIRMITTGQYRQILDRIPAHGAILIARIARECATVWTEFAEELDERVESA